MKACLEAQDRLGADVNLILLIEWLWAAGKQIENPQNIFTLSARLQQTTLTPLREKRKKRKGQSDYEALKRKELEAEKKAQARLIKIVETQPKDQGFAASLTKYFQFLGAKDAEKQAQELASQLRH